MSSIFVELIAELLEWYLDIKFWFKKKKRRRFEKKHNLSQEIMIYPSDKISIIFFGLGFVTLLVFFFLIRPSINENKTKQKLIEITEILEAEKKVLDAYPKRLIDIIRNNPLRRNLIKDNWDNEIQYQLSKDGLSYVLFSLGKDGILNTKDDIVLNN